MISPDQQRNDVLTRPSRAIVLMEESMDPRLLALRHKHWVCNTHGRDRAGVAAVAGGLVVRDNAVRAAGACGFGADAEIEKLFLTASKFDPEMCCAATIRYADAVRRVLEEMFLECCTIRHPWATPRCRHHGLGRGFLLQGGCPGSDLDPGASKETAVIHLFGENSAGVAGKIIMLSNRIIHIEL